MPNKPFKGYLNILGETNKSLSFPQYFGGNPDFLRCVVCRLSYESIGSEGRRRCIVPEFEIHLRVGCAISYKPPNSVMPIIVYRMQIHSRHKNLQYPGAGPTDQHPILGKPYMQIGSMFLSIITELQNNLFFHSSLHFVPSLLILGRWQIPPIYFNGTF